MSVYHLYVWWLQKPQESIKSPESVTIRWLQAAGKLTHVLWKNNGALNGEPYLHSNPEYLILGTNIIKKS